MRRLVFAAVTALAAACANGNLESDCRAVCDAHRNCVDSTTVSHTCEAECKDRSSSDEDYKQAVADCHDCLNKLTCSEFQASCGDVCAGVP